MQKALQSVQHFSSCAIPWKKNFFFFCMCVLKMGWVDEDCVGSKLSCKKNCQACRNSTGAAKFALVPPTVGNVTPPSLCHLHHHLLIPKSPVWGQKQSVGDRHTQSHPPNTDSNEKWKKKLLKLSQSIYIWLRVSALSSWSFPAGFLFLDSLYFSTLYKQDHRMMVV